jgi:hypothetical protein
MLVRRGLSRGRRRVYIVERDDGAGQYRPNGPGDHRHRVDERANDRSGDFGG